MERRRCRLSRPEDASRFLEQATFGATDADIHHLSLIGIQAWLNEQFNMPQVPQEPAVEQALILNNPPCAANNVKCNAALFVQNTQNEGLVQNAFWQQSLAGSDELRRASEVCAVRIVRHIGAELRGAEHAPWRGELLRSCSARTRSETSASFCRT